MPVMHSVFLRDMPLKTTLLLDRGTIGDIKSEFYDESAPKRFLLYSVMSKFPSNLYMRLFGASTLSVPDI